MLRPVHLDPSITGAALPWDVFTDAGVLVASAGMVVENETHYRRLIARPLYRRISPDEQFEPLGGVNPLERLDTLAREAEGLLVPPYTALLADPVQELARGILATLRVDPEACLGYLRLTLLARPSVHHSLHVLVVAALISEHLDADDNRLTSLACAALTMNISILDVLDRLHHYPRLLDDKIRAILAAHPRQSVEYLRQGGVTDEGWLRAVAEHHEHIDGSGYPTGLALEAISPMARTLRIVDFYCARITGRHYLPPKSPRAALKDIFGRERPHLDAQISAQLVRVMGLHPPGTLLRLANGEVACITRRGRGGLPHFATSFLDSRGRLLELPRERPLAHPAFAPRGFLTPDRDWPALNWKRLWGYT